MRPWLRLPAISLALLTAALLVPGAAAALARHTQRLSLSSAGVQGNGNSADYTPAVSADGRFVAFVSAADNLVPGDTNAVEDVFVRDRTLRKTFFVSVSSAGARADAASYGRPAISADGRFVVFSSNAGNLVPGDTNGKADVFVRDLKLHKTVRVSVSSAGVQGDGHSDSPSISPDGRYVGFASFAGNLVPGDSNSAADVFVRDRKLHRTVRVSVSSAGIQGDNYSYDPAISADGRFVAFGSDAGNLVPGDTNAVEDVFVRDRKLHTTVLVSGAAGGFLSDGDSYGAAISSDGRFVGFASYANNLTPGDINGVADVFVRDRKLHKTSLVSVSSTGARGDARSSGPASVSADGRFVTFGSDAGNLVPGDTNGFQDAFVRDLKLHKTVRVSVSSAGVQGNKSAYTPALSADGRFVAFASEADNLVLADTNGFLDLFVRGPYR